MELVDIVYSLVEANDNMLSNLDIAKMMVDDMGVDPVYGTHKKIAAAIKQLREEGKLEDIPRSWRYVADTRGIKNRKLKIKK